MLDLGLCFLPNGDTLFKSDFEILSVGFTSLMRQNFHLVLGPKMLPRVSEPQHVQLDKTGAERGV